MDEESFEYRNRGVLLLASERISELEAAQYIDRGLEKFGSKLSRIIVNVDGGYAGVTYLEIGDYHPFERVRRLVPKEPAGCEVCAGAEKLAYHVRRLGVNESYLRQTTFSGICNCCPRCGRSLDAS
ncbi:MAG: hypothetical protein KBT28_12515 [Bacteroidales bacterium]|nr:hypothetical protein [Candidatus Colimorpha merdihippi]